MLTIRSVIISCLLVHLTFAQRGEREVGIKKLQQVFAWDQITFNIDGNAVISDRFGKPVQSSETSEGWTFPEEDTPTQAEAEPAAATTEFGRFFIQYNNVPMGVERWKNKVFIAIPRRRLGVPSTLNYVELNGGNEPTAPGLKPYPDLASNLLSSSQTSRKPLVSVYRPTVDKCDRLWAVDTGVLDNTGVRRNLQPPAIVIFDLKTDRLIHRYELKEDDYINGDASGFVSITVDVINDDCSNTFAYLPDLTNFGLVVYRLRDDRSWRVYHNYFYPDPEQGDFDLNGLRFQWNDGVFSLALGPKQPDGYRTAYVHAMASHRERSVSTAILRNETLATRDFHGNDFKVVGDKGPNTMTTIHAVHDGVMIMSLVGKNALGCWNTRKPLNPKNVGIIAQDSNLFQYPSDMHIDSDNNIWIIVNKLPSFLYRDLNINDINFRVYKISFKDAISGTVCA